MHSHNITEIRGPERRYRWTLAQGKDYTEPTGYVEEYEMTGLFTQLKARGSSMASGQGGSVSRAIELSHVGGGFGRMRVTETHYRIPSTENPEEPGGGDSGSTEKPGDSETSPSISVSYVRTEESILSHPRFSAVVGVPQYAEALSLLRGGGRMSDYVYDEYAPQKRRTIRELCEGASGALAEVLDLIMAGVHSYVTTRPVVTVRYRVASPGAATGNTGIVGSVPGCNISMPGCDWLCVPGGVESDGESWWATATYECSGPGGWNKVLYGNS